MPDSSRNLTQSEWEPHQAKITRLYQTPGMTLEKIMNTMLEQDQLDARYVFNDLFYILQIHNGFI